VSGHCQVSYARETAHHLKADARETHPDDPDAQRAYMFQELVVVMKNATGNEGLVFWRTLGNELSK
jgi:hypothetical protein